MVGHDWVSPQRSNRGELLEGTLRCLERLPFERVTTRAIALESGANQASITYHFGSKDALVTAAIVTGLDRWLAEVEQRLESAGEVEPGERIRVATRAVQAGRDRHRWLFDNFLVAVTRSRHDQLVRETLYDGIQRTRLALARLLGLGSGREGADAGALVLATFYGLALQDSVDPRLRLSSRRVVEARTRLADLARAALGRT